MVISSHAAIMPLLRGKSTYPNCSVFPNHLYVTVDGPITVADSLTSVTCDPLPNPGLAPGETLACTATYTLKAGDLQVGSVTNVAKGSGSFAGVVVASPSANAIYPVSAVPALTLVKDSTPSNASFAAAGDVVTYLYTVTNTGKAGFTGDVSITDDHLPAAFVCRPASNGVFAVGASFSCNATYTVTQGDVDAGSVTNEAVAQTTFAPGTVNQVDVTSPPASKTVVALTAPALSVVKTVTAGPNPAALDDVLSYQITVTNTGNQTIKGVKATDARLGVLACTVNAAVAPANVVLKPIDAMICTGSYQVTQADIDAQSLINTATASGSDPTGGRITVTGQHDQPLVAAAPSVRIVKSLVPDPFSAPAFTAPGQTLTFVMTVTNTGNVMLNTLAVTDTRVAGSCAVNSLAPGAVDSSCRFSYVTTQADVDAVIGSPAHGGFVNTGAVTAQPANPGAAPVADRDDLDVLGPTHAPAFTLVKSADVSSASAFGDQVNYSYLVTNSGNITLHVQPVVADDKIAAVTCPALAPAGLAPGASLTCTARYSVAQADVDAGFVTNTASVSSTEVTAPATDSLTLPITAAPGLTVDKTASITADAKVGDVIDYSYTVSNTGNVSLTAVTVDDQHTDASGTADLPIAGDTLSLDAAEQGNSTDAAADGIWDNLGPGDVVSFTASYTVTQADIDAGRPISNVVTVTATTPTGPLPDPATDSVSVTVQAPAPGLEAVKLVDVSGLSTPPVAGEVLPYSITISNTGNQTLKPITLSDTLRRVDGTALALNAAPAYVSGDAGVSGALEVGETWTYTASYTLTQADIDGGGVVNQVTVRGKTPAGGTVSDLSDDDVAPGGDDPTKVIIAPVPKIIGEKTITSGPVTVGSTVVFKLTATNAGNVSLSDVKIATDTLRRADNTVLGLTSGPSFDGASNGSPAGQLLPGEVAQYSATYVLTQADVDAGGINNSAIVSGLPPTGAPVTDVSDNGDDSDGNTTNDPTTLLIAPQPGLALVKRLAAGSGPSYDAAGQTLSFVFEVRNTGNVTLAAPLQISDAMVTGAGGVVTCPTGSIAPAAVVICTANYTVTQADVDAGSVTNRATASSGAVSSPEASVTVPAQRDAALTVVKTAAPLPTAQFVVGAVAQYSYVVTNSGNVTITAPISISDNLIAAAAITCPALPVGGLAPAATLTCSASYTITADDVVLGSVTNLATATDGTVISPIATETIPDAAAPALGLVKTATSGAGFAAVGDSVGYSYTVTNTGTRAYAKPVTVVDDKLGEIACFVPSVANPDLTTGETATCTATHIVTQADLDAGKVVNQAFAHTTFGAGGTEVVSAPDVVTVTAQVAPAIRLSKSATPNPVPAVGTVVTYQLNAVNTGNQTLRAIDVIDPMLPGLVCQAAVLLPDQSVQCDADYTVTQADIDRGTLVNTATASAVTPQGAAVGDSASATTDLPAAVPALTLVKSALPSPFGAVGSTLTYAFAVTNSGNVTLTNLTVTDPMDPAFSCAIAQLPPDALDATCRLTTVVTQDQVDAGSISNTANVSGTDPRGTRAAAQDSITTPGPTQRPGIEATKVLTSSGSQPGATIGYTLLVRNSGNVTLSPSVPVDTMTRLDSSATQLDSGLTLISGDDGNGRLDVGETWTYSGSHVLTQADVDAGGLRNQVSVAALTPTGGSVSDVSDNGDDSDGNSTDDPTVFAVTNLPMLEVTKRVTQGGNAVGDAVVFSITAVNTGAATIGNLVIADTMTRADGAGLTGTLAGGSTTLAPGAAAVWTLGYTLHRLILMRAGLPIRRWSVAQAPMAARSAMFRTTVTTPMATPPMMQPRSSSLRRLVCW